MTVMGAGTRYEQKRMVNLQLKDFTYVQNVTTRFIQKNLIFRNV